MTLRRMRRLLSIPMLCALARGDENEAYVWRARTWPLRALTEEQYASWEADGFVVVRGATCPVHGVPVG